MGHHINSKGQFQSDRHPCIGPDKIVVSFRHQEAWPVLAALAEAYQHRDAELAADIRNRLRTCRGLPLDDEPEIDLLAKTLAGAELNYRNDHDQKGDGHTETGRRWDAMRRAGDAIRQYFAAKE